MRTLCSALGMLAALAASGAASAYTVGNPTPQTIFFVQGQSFTPAISGSTGTGTPTAGPGGTAQLASFQIAFAPNAVPPQNLYIYSTLPTNGAAATGAGSIATGTHVGGGLYTFSPAVTVPFATQSFAVLPACFEIFDAPDSYAGGTDLFPVNCPPPGANPIVQGTFDIGFTAQFVDVSNVPTLGTAATTSLALLLVAVGLVAVGRRAG